MYYRIEEVVTRQGHFITLPGMHDTPASAFAALRRERNNGGMRVAEYRAGWTAERVRTVSLMEVL